MKDIGAIMLLIMRQLPQKAQNQRKIRDLKYCQNKLAKRLKTYPNTKKLVQCTLSESESGVISLEWLWNKLSAKCRTTPFRYANLNGEYSI